MVLDFYRHHSLLLCGDRMKMSLPKKFKKFLGRQGRVIIPKALITRPFRTNALERITCGSHITYYSLMFFIAYTFKGQVHVFAGRVTRPAGHVKCLNYFCPLRVNPCFAEPSEILSFFENIVGFILGWGGGGGGRGDYY